MTRADSLTWTSKQDANDRGFPASPFLTDGRSVKIQRLREHKASLRFSSVIPVLGPEPG